jgi:hypothetical protein
LTRENKAPPLKDMIPPNRTLVSLLLIGLVYLGGFINGCGCARARNTPSQNDTVTISHTKTVWVPVRDTLIEYVPVPRYVSVPRVDSFIAYEKVPYAVLDTVYVLGDYFAKVAYRDSVPTLYGPIIISDTVSRNRIAARSVLLDLRVPHTVEYRNLPKRNEVWVGVQTFYRPWDDAAAVGGSLEFLHKRGVGMEVFGNVDTRGVGEVGLGAKYRIQLRHR